MRVSTEQQHLNAMTCSMPERQRASCDPTEAELAEEAATGREMLLLFAPL